MVDSIGVMMLNYKVDRLMLVVAYVAEHVLTEEQHAKLAKILQGEGTVGIALDLAKQGKPIPWDELTE